MVIVKLLAVFQNADCCNRGSRITKIFLRAGPCVIAHASSPQLACTPEGDFEPLQCHGEHGVTTCQCIHPEDGSLMPGTQVMISDLDDTPNCNLLGSLIWKLCSETFV